MSSIKRALSGDVLVFDLQAERSETLATVERGGHSARTLLKSGPLRVTQVVMAPDGEIAEHQVAGSLTVQPLDGRIRFTAGGKVHELGPGQLLSTGPGVRHSVTSRDGATFLLTISKAESADAQLGSLIETDVGIERNKASRGVEAWLRGPLAEVPVFLMPAAHALVQAREDLQDAAEELTAAELWSRPGGAASIGFHLRHIAGSLDRLFTYARGVPLGADQLADLKREGVPGTPPASAEELLAVVGRTVEHVLRGLQATPAGALLDYRAVGRGQLPSNVLGLLFHAAEHTQRHTGQVITTAKILRGLSRQTR